MHTVSTASYSHHYGQDTLHPHLITSEEAEQSSETSCPPSPPPWGSPFYRGKAPTSTEKRKRSESPEQAGAEGASKHHRAATSTAVLRPPGSCQTPGTQPAARPLCEVSPLCSTCAVLHSPPGTRACPQLALPSLVAKWSPVQRSSWAVWAVFGFALLLGCSHTQLGEVFLKLRATGIRVSSLLQMILIDGYFPFECNSYKGNHEIHEGEPHLSFNRFRLKAHIQHEALQPRFSPSEANTAAGSSLLPVLHAKGHWGRTAGPWEHSPPLQETTRVPEPFPAPVPPAICGGLGCRKHSGAGSP